MQLRDEQTSPEEFDEQISLELPVKRGKLFSSKQGSHDSRRSLEEKKKYSGYNSGGREIQINDESFVPQKPLMTMDQGAIRLHDDSDSMGGALQTEMALDSAQKNPYFEDGGTQFKSRINVQPKTLYQQKGGVRGIFIRQGRPQTHNFVAKKYRNSLPARE